MKLGNVAYHVSGQVEENVISYHIRVEMMTSTFAARWEGGWRRGVRNSITAAGDGSETAGVGTGNRGWGDL